MHIVGIGDDGIDGLTKQARAVIDGAEVIIGNRALLQSLGQPKSTQAKMVTRQWRFAGTAGSHQRTWHQADRLLAGGDSLFYGIAKFLLSVLAKIASR